MTFTTREIEKMIQEGEEFVNTNIIQKGHRLLEFNVACRCSKKLVNKKYLSRVLNYNKSPDGYASLRIVWSANHRSQEPPPQKVFKAHVIFSDPLDFAEDLHAKVDDAHGEIESSGGEVLTSNMTCACTPKFMNRLFFMTTLAPIVMTGMSGLDFIEARAKRRIKQMVLDKAGENIFDPKNLKAKDKQTFMGNFERAGRKLKIFAAALTATANVERAFRGTVGDSMAVVGALYEQQA